MARLLHSASISVGSLLVGRVFDHPGGTEVELQRIGVEAEPVGTHLWFRVLG